MVLSAASLGLRASEIMGLQWSDFDWSNRTVLIRRGVVNGSIGDTKTEASRKALPVDSALAKALLEWRKYQSPNTKPDARVDLVDLSSQQDILRREIKPAALRAGIWKIGWPLFHFSTLLFHHIAEHGSRHQGATRVAETLDCTKHDERLHASHL